MLVFKNTKWYIYRMSLIIILFLGFGSYFFYDGYIGYPKKQVIYKKYQSIKEAYNKYLLLTQKENSDFDDKWNKYIEDENLPDILKNANYFEEGGISKMWSQYTIKKGWSDKVPKDYTVRQIQEQYFFGCLCSVIGLTILSYFLINLNKKLKLDKNAVILPNGDNVLFKNIYKIDKRKWDKKGLSYIYYNNKSNRKKRGVLDCLRYGEKSSIVLDKIMDNFDGYIIDNKPKDNIEEDIETSDSVNTRK